MDKDKQIKQEAAIMAKMNPNMANREVMNLVLLDYKTKVPFMKIDFANVSTTNFQANRVYAKGGWGAPNRVGFDGERTGTLQIDTQIMPVKLFALLSGKEIAKTATVLKREELTAGADGIQLSETPKTGTVQVFAAGDDCGTPISDINVAEKKVTATGITENKNYIAYYYLEKAKGVQSVKFDADTFPKAFEIRGEMPFKTEDEEEVMCDLAYYKAQPQATFNLAFQNTGDPTTVSITFDCYANQDGDIYDMTFEDGTGEE